MTSSSATTPHQLGHLPSPDPTSPASPQMAASAYPRKKAGVLFTTPTKSVGLGIVGATAHSSAVVDQARSGAPRARNPLPTPPRSGEPSPRADADRLSSQDEDELRSVAAACATLKEERRLKKDQDRQRRRLAEADRAARKEARRKTIHYPKSWDTQIQQLIADKYKAPKLQDPHQEDADVEDEVDDDVPLSTAARPKSAGSLADVEQPSSPVPSPDHSPALASAVVVDDEDEDDRSDGAFEIQDLPGDLPFTLPTLSPFPISLTPANTRRQRRPRHVKPAASALEAEAPPAVVVEVQPSAEGSVLVVTTVDLLPSSPVGPSQLRLLAGKLASVFPEDEFAIESQVAVEESGTAAEGVVDQTDDLAPQEVHVFVDHSNILVGLLQQPLPVALRPLSPPSSPPGPLFAKSAAELWGTPVSKVRSSSVQQAISLSTPKLSHSALSLLLLRGRNAKTKAVVASSPLHQSMADLQHPSRGPWDVSVLRRVRVDDLYVGMTGSGGDGTSGEDTEGGGGAPTATKTPTRGRRRPSVSRGNGQRPKQFKEQAVDELLQLKILQTILLHPPSTLVLATGDCAGSPLNPAGFRGCVEIALDRGWNVEVWGWKHGIGQGWRELERSWAKKGRTSETMVVRELDAFGDLLRAENGVVVL